MELQKKRISTKKIKQSKTQIPQENPLGSLMQQINQLKSQLATIKSKKTIKPLKQNQENAKQVKPLDLSILSPKSQLKNQKSSKKSLDDEKEASEIKQIVFPIRENQLKLNIELGKLSQIIYDNDHSKTIQKLNKIIVYLNKSVSQLQGQSFRKTSQSPFVNTCAKQDPLHSWRQQSKLYQQLNNELEKQNIQFKHLIARQTDQISKLTNMNLEIREQYNVLIENVMGMEQQLQRFKLICGGLRNQRSELEQKIKVYEKSIEKKQSQLVLYEQDINFSRLQVEKNKSQKRQLEKMFENLQKDFKQLKSKYEIQLDFTIKQRNKWKLQCQNRRINQKQSLNNEEFITQLKKQLQIMRRECSILNEQGSTKKQRLCEEQKKNMILQQQNYRLRTDNEKLIRSVQYCKQEIRQMERQVQQLRETSKKYRDAAIKSKVGVKNTNKSQALRQIQELIQKHKSTDQNTQKQ